MIFVVSEENLRDVKIKCPYCGKGNGDLLSKIKKGTMTLVKCENCLNIYEVKREERVVYSILKHQ